MYDSLSFVQRQISCVKPSLFNTDLDETWWKMDIPDPVRWSGGSKGEKLSFYPPLPHGRLSRLSWVRDK